MLLNAAELIQIGAGEPGQYLLRDSDSWPLVPLGDQPIIVNALIALDSTRKWGHPHHARKLAVV